MIKDLESLIRRNELAQERFKDLEEYFGGSKSILEDRKEFKKWLERGKQNTKKVDELESKLEQQPSDDCVSRQAVLDLINADWKYEGLELSVNELPPVTPAHCIAAVRFSKEDLREICNERIEVECTHGTCKDCFYYNIDEDGHGYHCEKYGHTRFPVYADFYCKDYEKRGDENGSN